MTIGDLLKAYGKDLTEWIGVSANVPVESPVPEFARSLAEDAGRRARTNQAITEILVGGNSALVQDSKRA